MSKLKSAFSATGLAVLLSLSHPVLAQTVPDQVPVDSQPVPLPPTPAPAPAPAQVPQPIPVPAVPVLPPVQQAPLPVIDPAVPAPTLPVPSTVTPPPAGTSTVSGDIRNARTLNPVLNPTDEEIRTAIADGRKFAKKDRDVVDILNNYARAFSFKHGGMLGEVRRPLGVVYALMPSLEAQWRGFLESREFATNDTRDQDFSSVRDHVAGPHRVLSFIVQISPDALGKDLSAGKDAASFKSALGNVRFVLSDNKDNNYDPEDAAPAPRIVERKIFFDSIAGAPDKVFTAASTEDLPLASTAPLGTQLVKPRDKEMGLAAFYLVSFELFNADGTARVNRDSKYVSLRVLLPNGAKYAAYNLDPFSINAQR